MVPSPPSTPPYTANMSITVNIHKVKLSMSSLFNRRVRLLHAERSPKMENEIMTNSRDLPSHWSRGHNSMMTMKFYYTCNPGGWVPPRSSLRHTLNIHREPIPGQGGRGRTLYYLCFPWWHLVRGEAYGISYCKISRCH